MFPQDGREKLDQYARQAVDLALQGRWQDAVDANKAILELSPDDVEAHNRLGRALLETGEYAAAKQAYARALEIDPYNAIARKNVKRLSELGETAPKDDRRKVVTDIFVEETSKARVVSLVNLGPREVLARKTPGEEVSLQVKGDSLTAQSDADEYLGEVDPKYGMRLAKLIRGGNQYIAAIKSLGSDPQEDEVKILVREVYQHPSQARRPSFPLQKRERFRPYVRESLLRQRLEEESGEDADESPEMEPLHGLES